MYRYFGGLSGLIAAYADGDDFMPGASELLSLCDGGLRELPARARLAECLKTYVAALSRRPATVQILLRLPSFDAEILAALRVGRARGIAEVRAAFGEPDPSLGFDLEVGFSLLVSGTCQVLNSRRSSWHQDEAETSEVVDSLCETIQGILNPP